MHEITQASNVGRSRLAAPNFMMGALVGAGVALLLAPASGRDTRQRIGHTAQRLGSGARNVVTRTRSTIAGIREDARNAFASARQEFQRTRARRMGAATSTGTP